MRSTKKSTIRRRRPEDLTVRERQILELIWKGFMNREIAMRLKIAVKTVGSHRATMMKKVRVQQYGSTTQDSDSRRPSLPLGLSESQPNPN
jgi:FixJ family two-component response regulator